MTIEIRKVVNGMRDEIISFLQRYVQIPSENPPGNYDKVCEFLKEELTHLGFDEVDVIEVPEELSRKFGHKTRRKNVIATMKGLGGGKKLIFNSHLDTVPIGDEKKWTYPPFSGEIADGKLYGRGATDSKGRLTAYIMSAVSLKRSQIPFRGDIIIAATCDEETGGVLGAGYITNNHLVSGDMVVVEGYSNQIVRAMAGVLQLKIISKGIPAHAGFKWRGINAVEKMGEVISGLKELQEKFKEEPSQIEGMKYTTVNIGVIKGGTKVNVVPDFCEIEVDFRVIPEHTLDEVYNSVLNIIGKINQEDPEATIDVIRIPDFQTQPTVTEEDSLLIDEIQKAVQEVNGHTLPVVGMLGQADTRWFVKNGIPGINFGPGSNENNLHGYDEYMEIDDLVKTTEVLAVLARNFTK